MIRPLASGSFGQIFLVHHKHEKKNHVLKKISVLSLDAKERESVEQEVEEIFTFLKNVFCHREGVIIIPFNMT